MRASSVSRTSPFPGFTLLEMIIVMAILLVLITLGTISIGPLFQSTNLTKEASIFVSDARTTQLNALRAQTEDGSVSSPYSIYLQPDRYTTFAGTSYNVNNDSNFTVVLPESVRLTTIDTPTPTLTFNQLTGQVANFDPAHHSLTFTYVPSGATLTVRFNRYGVWEVLE